MAGWESFENAQWTQACHISIKQVKIQIKIQNVTCHWDDVDGAAIPDTFQQPPLNYSPLHSIFAAENVSPEHCMPPTGSDCDYMDGLDDFSLFDWTSASLGHLPEVSETFLQPPSYESGYMYNSLEDVDLNDLWPNTNLHLQQTSVNVRSTRSNLLLCFEHETTTAHVSGRIDTPDGRPLLPATSEGVLYHPQSPGMPSDCTQMMVQGNHPEVAHNSLGELLPQGRMTQDVVNYHVSPPWHGSAQFSQTRAASLNINRQPLHAANRQQLNKLHSDEIQAGGIGTQGQRVRVHSVPIISFYNQPMMGKMVAGVSRATEQPSPQNGEIVILEEIQLMNGQKSGAPVSTGQKFTKHPHHLPMLGNALPHSSRSAAKAKPVIINLPPSSDRRPVSGSISGSIHRPEDVKFLHQTPENVVYLQQTPDLLSNYRQQFYLETPVNHPQAGNMMFVQPRAQLPQGWIPLQILNPCASTAWRGPSELTNVCPANLNVNPHGSLPKYNRHMLSKLRPDKTHVEDGRTEGHRVPFNKAPAGSISNQNNIGKQLPAISTSTVHQAPHEGAVLILEENQSRKRRKSEVPAAVDGNVTGDSYPIHQSLSGNAPTYSVKSAVNVRPTPMNLTSSSTTQAVSRCDSGHMYTPKAMQLLPVTSESVLYIQELNGMPSDYTQQYQMVGPGGHSHVANVNDTKLRDQLPQGGIAHQTLNPHLSIPLYRPGPSQLTEVCQANLNINSHAQPLPTDKSQRFNKPHPEKIQTEDSLHQGPPVPFNSTSTSSVSNQHKKVKLVSGVSTVAGHPVTHKGETVKSEESQSTSSQKSRAQVADNRTVQKTRKDQEVTGVRSPHNPSANTHNLSTATISRRKKVCSIQDGDKPPHTIRLKEEASCIADPIQQTDSSSAVKTQLNMRKRKSVTVLQKQGDKAEQGTVQRTSDIASRNVLGNSVCTPKSAQSTHKSKVSGEGTVPGHSNHSGKSTTKRKHSDSKSQTSKKMKTQICAPDKLLLMKQSITPGHEMYSSDIHPGKNAQDIEKPKKGNKRKRQCKTAEQHSFKRPRSDLAMNLLASVEVFHKLGDKGKDSKNTNEPKKRTPV